MVVVRLGVEKKMLLFMDSAFQFWEDKVLEINVVQQCEY